MSKTTVSASAIALPSPSRRRFLAVGSTATVLAGLHAAAAAEAAAASSPLLDLIEAHRATTVAIGLAEEYDDAQVELIGEVAAEANSQFQRLCFECIDLIEQICEHPARDMAEARVKAAYLLENIAFDECCCDEFKYFVRSFLT